MIMPTLPPYKVQRVYELEYEVEIGDVQVIMRGLIEADDIEECFDAAMAYGLRKHHRLISIREMMTNAEQRFIEDFDE